MLIIGRKKKNKMRVKKILILGASSDIGIEVIKLLIKNNWIIYAHCNKNSKTLKKFNRNVKIVKINFSNNIYQINKKIKKLEKIDFDAFLNLVGYIDTHSFEKFGI